MTEPFEDIARLALPYSREATVRVVEFDSGMKMTRLILREGKRITQVDLDADSASALARALTEGADRS